MNTIQLQEIIQNYLSQYEFVNNRENDELFKWRAAAFMYGMNPFADDFLSKLKMALRALSVLCTEENWQPATGISVLCDSDKADKESEVHTAFKVLFGEDGGEIEERYNNILRFVGLTNAMIDAYMPESERVVYEQDIRSALTYLGLMRTDKDFLIEADAAQHFALFTEYESDIVSDDTVNLEAYYNMCNELIYYIKEDTDLLKTVQARLEYEGTVAACPCSLKDIDKGLHLLAYDIIHCTEKYGFYETHPIPKKKRLTANQLKLEAQKKQIRNNIYEIQQHINKAASQLDEIENLDMTGMTVTHAKFGDGEVIEHDGDRLTVLFSIGEKTLSLKTAFSKGLLEAEDEEITELCSSILDTEEKVKALQLRQRAQELELEKI
ncbi:MAG: hypothetical protein K6A23_01825 [Butyrivibrio sp.]|nr:hypothetical protein [Butyrivibrio sp.]